MTAMNATRWSPTLKRTTIAVLMVAAIFLIYRAGDIVRPFLWAAIVGYILLPVVRILEERLGGRRGLASAIVFVAVLVFVFGGLRFLAPLAIGQMQTFQRTLPTLVANAQNTLAETLDQIGAEDLVPSQSLQGGAWEQDTFQRTLDGQPYQRTLPVEEGLEHLRELKIRFPIGARQAPHVFGRAPRIAEHGNGVTVRMQISV